MATLSQHTMPGGRPKRRRAPVIFDVHGVLLGRREPVGHLSAGAVVAAVREAGHPVRLLTNSSSLPRSELAGQLAAAGVQVSPDEIDTAALGAADYIRRHLAPCRLYVIGSGYTYLQEFLPNVAQAIVRGGWADAIGLGRAVLSYPAMLADAIQGRPVEKKFICRTFSDCTTAPRNGLPSGCYPLDSYYKSSPAAAELRVIKAKA